MYFSRELCKIKKLIYNKRNTCVRRVCSARAALTFGLTVIVLGPLFVDFSCFGFLGFGVLPGTAFCSWASFWQYYTQYAEHMFQNILQTKTRLLQVRKKSIIFASRISHIVQKTERKLPSSPNL